MIRYIERMSDRRHAGPAWIANVVASRTHSTVYFNGMALAHIGGGGHDGNHIDPETGDFYWVSGVKRRGSNRHWAGSGKIMVERTAVEYVLALQGRATLDSSLFQVIDPLPATDPRDFVEKANRSYRLESRPPSGA